MRQLIAFLNGEENVALQRHIGRYRDHRDKCFVVWSDGQGRWYKVELGEGGCFSQDAATEIAEDHPTRTRPPKTDIQPEVRPSLQTLSMLRSMRPSPAGAPTPALVIDAAAPVPVADDAADGEYSVIDYLNKYIPFTWPTEKDFQSGPGNSAYRLGKTYLVRAGRTHPWGPRPTEDSYKKMMERYGFTDSMLYFHERSNGYTLGVTPSGVAMVRARIQRDVPLTGFLLAVKKRGAGSRSIAALTQHTLYDRSVLKEIADCMGEGPRAPKV